jgi:hypothetical protein
VHEPSKVWATRIPILEAPDLALFLYRTETLTGYAAKPLREWQYRDTYPRRLAGRIAGLLRQPRRCSQLLNLGTEDAANSAQQPLLRDRIDNDP